MPFVEIRLKTNKPASYPTTPQTLGDHLEKRRHELDLFQKDVAALLEVDAWTVCNWEKDRTYPPIRYFPKIMDFLGYDPFPAPRSLSERFVARRRRLVLSQKQLARRMGVDEGTRATWEIRCVEANRLAGTGRRDISGIIDLRHTPRMIWPLHPNVPSSRSLLRSTPRQLQGPIQTRIPPEIRGAKRPQRRRRREHVPASPGLCVMASRHYELQTSFTSPVDSGPHLGQVESARAFDVQTPPDVAPKRGVRIFYTFRGRFRGSFS